MKINSKQRKKRERKPNSSEKSWLILTTITKDSRDTENKLVITSKEREWGRGNRGAAD